MIKKTVTPHNTDLHILIPEGYVGKRIEVILYSVEEAEATGVQAGRRKKPSDFAGTLSREDAKGLLDHVIQSRNEWERGI